MEANQPKARTVAVVTSLFGAPSLPFALLCDTGGGACKHFFFDSWCNVNICQLRALEGYCRVIVSGDTSFLVSDILPFFFSMWELSSDTHLSGHQGPAPLQPQATLSSPSSHFYRPASATPLIIARGSAFPLH